MSIVLRRRLSVASLAFIFLSLTAYADTSLTLVEAQRLAIERSERLAVKRFSLQAANELTAAAGQLADPVLRLGVENVPVTGPDSFALDADSMTMARVGVMQEFTRGAKRELRTQRANLSVAMAEAEQADTRAQVERATALAWFDAFFAEQRLQVIRAQLLESQAAAVAAESAFAQGRGTAADALAERAMVIEAQDRLAEAHVAERSARTALSRWIGDVAQRPLQSKPAIERLPLHGHRDLVSLEAALREHPDIVLLDKQLELARTEAALARAERQSDWSVELVYGKRGAQYDDMVSLGVSIPLQLNRGKRQNRELASRLALASAAKAQRDDLYREHVTEVRVMLDEWNTTRERLERYSNEMKPLAKDRVLAAEAAYRGGKATLDSVLAARRNQLDVTLQSLALERTLAQLWAELSFLGAANEVATISTPTPSPVVGEGRGEGLTLGVTP